MNSLHDLTWILRIAMHNTSAREKQKALQREAGRPVDSYLMQKEVRESSAPRTLRVYDNRLRVLFL